MEKSKINEAPKVKGPNDQYGLVLGGGGSKGCYHVGVWTAFNEQGLFFDAVSGTSIGALVGIFYPGNHIEPVTDFVMDMQPTNIAEDLPYYPQTLKQTIRGSRTILNFVIRYKDSRMDIRPLREHFRAMFDYDTFKASPVRFACMSYNDTKKEAHPFYKGEITAENVEDIVMASSACYPAFPKVVIDGDEYVDGMYADNVPIELLQSILPCAAWTAVVDLHDPGEPVPPALKEDMFYIQPLLQPGNPLDFSTQHAERLYAQGYLETMKYLGKYPGHLYTFRTEDKPLMDIVEDYIGAQLTQMKIILPKSENLTNALYRGVLGYVPPEMPNHFQENYEFGQMVEALALMAKVNPIALYDYRDFLEKIIENLESVSITKLNPEEFALMNLFHAISKEELPTQLYKMLQANGGRFSERIESLKQRIPVSYTLAVIHYILQLLLEQLSPKPTSQTPEPEQSQALDSSSNVEKESVANDNASDIRMNEDHPDDNPGNMDSIPALTPAKEQAENAFLTSHRPQEKKAASCAGSKILQDDAPDTKQAREAALFEGVSGDDPEYVFARIQPAPLPQQKASVNSAPASRQDTRARIADMKEAAVLAQASQENLSNQQEIQDSTRAKMPPLPKDLDQSEYVPARLPKYKVRQAPIPPAIPEDSKEQK